MILYPDKLDKLTKLLKEQKNTFSSILIKGDYGKGKSTLINCALNDLTNPRIVITQYPGMVTPYEALSSALQNILEKQGSNLLENKNPEDSYREYLKRLLINFCRKTPNIVVVFQDMKEYEENFIGLIEEIIVFMKEHGIPCLILMEFSTDNLTFTRREQLEKLEKLCQHKIIELNSTDYNEYSQFISSLLDSNDNFTFEQKKSIIKEAFFNPSLIQRMVSYFKDTGIFYRKKNIWECDEMDFHITAKLFEQYIYNRYLKLDDELKKTLKKASITGFEINPELLYQPLGIIRSVENLKRIERLSQLIIHTEKSYEFENNSVYNLIYGKMCDSEKKASHRLVAEYLYSKIENYKPLYIRLNVLNSIKSHYLYAECLDEALHILGCYIQQSYLGQNFDAALNGIKEFKKLSNEKYPYAEQQLILKEIKIQQILGNFSQSYTLLNTVKSRYLPVGSEHWIEYWKAYILFNNGQTNEAKEIADELIKKFDNKDIINEYLLLKLDILLAGMYHHFGNVHYAAKRYEQGMDISSKKLKYQKEYNYLLSISNMFLIDEFAIQQISKSMKYFKEKHLMVSYAKSANNVAINHMYLGQYEEAKTLLNESIHIFSDMCSASVHYPVNNLATVFALTNQYSIALSYFKEALKNASEIFSVLWIKINIAQCRRKLGNYSECETLLNEIEEQINKMSINTSLLQRNLHIAKALLFIDIKKYSPAYIECEQALELEVNILQNDTYPIYLTKLLKKLSVQLELPLPSIVEPYKEGRESIYCRDLITTNAHWGNFLFWEM